MDRVQVDGEASGGGIAHVGNNAGNFSEAEFCCGHETVIAANNLEAVSVWTNENRGAKSIALDAGLEAFHLCGCQVLRVALERHDGFGRDKLEFCLFWLTHICGVGSYRRPSPGGQTSSLPRRR